HIQIALHDMPMGMRPHYGSGNLIAEFAHIAHHDTDLLLVIIVGNFVITFIVLLIRIMFLFLRLFGKFFNIFGERGQGNLSIILGSFGDLLVALFLWIWTKVGILIVRASQRSQEFLADEFSLKLGYGEGLCRFLDRVDGKGSIGIFAVLASTHPATAKRIERLKQSGVDYNN
ncbi:MAG: M48 family metalloprotease, partial [Lachnospiraceae bacterium]|nr:M48 family metalloprotease [Lachnospiraceae bacterium]